MSRPFLNTAALLALLLLAAAWLLYFQDSLVPNDRVLSPRPATACNGKDPLSIFAQEVAELPHGPFHGDLFRDVPNSERYILKDPKKLASLAAFEQLSVSDPGQWHPQAIEGARPPARERLEDTLLYLMSKAGDFAKEGRCDEALAHLNSCLRVLHGLTHVKLPVDRLHYNTGLQIGNYLEFYRSLLGEHPSVPKLRSTLQCLASSPPASREVFSLVLQEDYFRVKADLECCRRDIFATRLDRYDAGIDAMEPLPSGCVSFKRNQTLGLRLNRVQKDLRALAQGWPEAYRTETDAQALEAAAMNWRSPWRIYVTNNTVGQVTEKYIASFLRETMHRVMFAHAMDGIMKVNLALRLHELERHRLPEHLTDLCPDYLPSLPQDPFSGRVVILNPVTFAIYFPGMNLKDDGGQTNEGDPFSTPDMGMYYSWRPLSAEETAWLKRRTFDPFPQ